MKLLCQFQWGILCLFLSIGVTSYAQISASGQIRTRSELLNGQGNPRSASDEPAFFTSQRTRLNVGFTGYRTLVKVALQDTRVWGQDASTNNRTTNPSLNGLLLHEAWAEIALLDTAHTNKKGTALALKLGRQELMYDDSRLLGNLDWLQQGRRHDAAVLKFSKPNFYVHFGVAYNQNRELKNGGLYDGVPTGYTAGTNGIGTMYKSMQYLYLNKKFKNGALSFLVLKDDFQKYVISEAGTKTYLTGTWKRLTFGPNLQFKFKDHWNLATSAYLQIGKDKNGKDLTAYLYTVKASNTLNKYLTVSAGYDYTSGTSPSSTKNKSFDPLYGTPHKFWGQMDYFYTASGFGSGGLSDLYIQSNIKATNQLSFNLDLHQFNSASKITSSNDSELSTYLGNEIDLIAQFNLTKNIGFQAGYCTFFSTKSLAQIKNITNAQSRSDWAYLMINIQPEFLK